MQTRKKIAAAVAGLSLALGVPALVVASSAPASALPAYSYCGHYSAEDSSYLVIWHRPQHYGPYPSDHWHSMDIKRKATNTWTRSYRSSTPSCNWGQQLP